MDEIHDHKNELRSSTELLSAFQKSEGRDPWVEEEESNSIKETCAHPITSRYGNKDACANNLSNPPSDSLFKKTIIKTIIPTNANLSHKGTLSIQVSKMKDGTSSRSRRTRTIWITSMGHSEIGIVECVC